MTHKIEMIKLYYIIVIDDCKFLKIKLICLICSISLTKIEIYVV